jgi:pilus assembly protein Flp/PilA
MTTLKQQAANLLLDDAGQDLVEYALLAGLIALASIACIRTLAVKISNSFSSVGSQLTSAT